MLDAGTLIGHPGIDSTTGTKDIDTARLPKTEPFSEEDVGRRGMLEPAGPLQIDETNQNPESQDNRRLQYEVVRSSEEVNDTMHVPTMRPSSPSSVSSSRSSVSSPPTTPSSPSPSSPPKPLDTVVPLDHSGLVVEEAADEEHTLAEGQHNDVTTSQRTSFDLLEDVESNTAPTSPSSSTSSLPQVTITIPTSASVINIQTTSVNHESYGILSILRPRTDSGNNLNVRFAPLPELEPRKRKSTIPLGMAARSQLARRRRMHQEDYEDRDPYRPRFYAHVDAPAERSSAEVDNAELRILKKKMLEKLRKEEEEEALVEDSLVVLAKKMGSAGKHLWKKMMAQKAKGENVNLPREQQTTPSAGKTASSTVDPANLPPLVEEDEKKIDRLDEKPEVRNRNKLQFHDPQAPTLAT